MYKIKDILNKVHNADCLEFMKEMPNKSVDLVLTDPPYGIDFIPPNKKWSGESNDFEIIENDGGEIDYKFLINELERIAFKVIIFGAENFYSELPHSGRWICWDKRPSHVTNEMAGSAFELAWSNQTEGFYKMYRVIHGGVVNDDSLIGNNQKRFHTTQKPVKLFSQIISDYSEEGDTILDPFLGSGTTAVACKQLKRNYIGIEISEKYCEIARRRLEQEQLF